MRPGTLSTCFMPAPERSGVGTPRRRQTHRDHSIAVPHGWTGGERAGSSGSPAAWPFAGPCPAAGGAGGGRQGRGRGALGARSCAPRRVPFPRQLRPRAALRALRRGERCPAGVPGLPPTAPHRHPQRGPSSHQPGFPPTRLQGPQSATHEARRGRGPCQGERLPSPFPPLMLFGWTEGCLGESFSTLFHIHNGLNIGEQSGTWRAKPSPWSEPMTSPPR